MVLQDRCIYPLPAQIKTGAAAQTTVIQSLNEYDEIGRVKTIQKRQSHTSIASGTLSPAKVIAEIKYDALGQIKTKDIGRKGSTNVPLETLKYDYNIRGWLLGVNRNFVTSANTGAPDAGKWFGFDLGYDKPTNASGQAYSAQQHNGNIAGQSWRSAGDNIARQYRYSYDAANRLLKADFIQNQGSWGKSVNYDSWMGDGNTAASAYDLNGNILKMQQWGWTPGNNNTKIDDLTYSYFSNSNKLSAVNDTAAIQTGLGDFFARCTTKQ
jgi:hypothetical protein